VVNLTDTASYNLGLPQAPPSLSSTMTGAPRSFWTTPQRGRAEGPVLYRDVVRVDFCGLLRHEFALQLRVRDRYLHMDPDNSVNGDL